jgi:hypothetical protein
MSQHTLVQPEGDDVLSYERRKSWGFGAGGGGGSVGAVTFRSDSFVAYAGGRVNTTINAPAGVADDDFLLLIFEDGLVGAVAPVATPPAGFNILPGFPLTRSDSNPFTVDTYAWIKIAAAEPANYTITHANASSNAWMMSAFGADLVTPVDPGEISTATGLGATATAPTITTAINNSLIVYFCSKWNFPGITPPGGVTPVLTTRLDGTVTLLFTSTGDLAAAGATGNKVATGLPNTPTEPWATGLIAVRP